jgi:WD40 repeat protein
VLHEVLSGKHPFRRETGAETQTAILREEPARLSGLGVPEALERIVRRCLEKRPEDRFDSARDLASALKLLVGTPAAGAAEVEEPSPYPGLRSFTESEAGRFYGREGEVQALWEKLQERRLLALIGPSGAGKTSFVRAGVVASRPSGSAAVVTTPRTSPLLMLAQALAPELAGDPEGVKQLLRFEDVDVAVATLDRWRRGHTRALLVVDQLEELFTLNPPEVQVRFAGLLGRLATEADIHVLLVLRDDFLMRCHEHEALTPVFDALTPLGPLGGAGLRRALVEPAEKAGFRFEDEGLVEEMLAEVESERGALPLLAFAAARLWERRDREKRLLTRGAYEGIGGVAGGLAQHAEATLERIGPERQGMVREMFRNLVTSQGTRASIARDDLLSVFAEKRAMAAEVLRDLIDARLLTSYETPAAEAEAGEGTGEGSRHQIEVVHDSLLKAWPRLVRWQAQDEQGALLRDQLKQAAHLWGEKGRSPDVLWSGTAYQEFKLWRGRYPGTLTALEEDFARSMTERARRRKRLRRLVAGSVVAAAVVAAAVTGLLWRRSEAARDTAQAEALRAEASKLVALGRAELDRYPTAAVAYARKSLEVADTPEGRRFVVDTLWRSPAARILPVENESVWRADISPDSCWLAAFPFSGRLLLFEDNGSPPRVIQGQPPTGFPGRIRFTPNGEALLAQSPEEPCVHMYGVPDGREIRRFEPEPPGGYGATPQPKPRFPRSMDWTPLPRGILFRWWPARPSPGVREPFGIWPYDGGPPTLIGSLRHPAYAVVDPRGSRFLVRREPRLVLRPLVGGDDDTVERPLVTLGETGPTWWHGFDPGGDKVWSFDIKDGAGRLRVWSIGDDAPSEPRVFSMPRPEPEFAPAWDPTGSRVAWGSSAEKAIWVWDLADPPDAIPTVLRRPDANFAKQGLFASRGDWLVVSQSGSLAFWPLVQPKARVLTGHAERVNRLLVTSDSQSLLSCGFDGVRLWPLGPGRGMVRRIAAEFRHWCEDAVLSPDGQRMLLVGSSGAAWLAPSFEGGGRWLRPPEHDRYLKAAAWDGSGQRVAIGSLYTAAEPNVIVLCDLESGSQREFSLVPPGETGQGYDWGAYDLAFTPQGRLLVSGGGGLRWFDTDTGVSDWIWRLPKGSPTRFALTADGRRLVAASPDPRLVARASTRWEVVFVDLVRGERHNIRSHGDGVSAVGMDASGRTLVTGDVQGVVRVGLADGSEPHRLCCLGGVVNAVSISPDGRWIASAAGDEIRLWPMPDVTKPPLHTLPYDELMAKLRALTNLQVVEDEASATGYRLEIGPFPGWRDVPTW